MREIQVMRAPKLGDAESYLLETHNNIEEYMKGSKKTCIKSNFSQIVYKNN